jgi:asparagine synthase (glutamine-hydrolysing)
MCGIAGYYGQGNIEILKGMTRSLTHRGPDDEGFFVDDNVGLGQRRLSIIDLSPAGHQPMSNETGDVWISFNGEIYNFQKLRQRLKGQHIFRGSSDTEVIIHLYEEIGEEIFSELEGMFAIALYDQKKNKIILARDRMGKKPLYYAQYGSTLIFGSELKALHEHPLFEKKINILALKSYLSFESVPTPLSIFEKLRKLEPATILSFSGKEIEKKCFWNIDFTRGGGINLNMDEALRRLDDLIGTAVSERLVSDAPLGVLLSGGIDSSAIAYYAVKSSAEKIKTFSIGFKEASFDESAYARRVAEHLGTEHYEKIVSADDALAIIPRLAEILDEPMADQSILPTYLLSVFTREKVTVALGGDGGDEIFSGYVTFVAHRLAHYYEKLPESLRKRYIEHFLSRLPTSHSYLSFDFKIKSFIAGFDGNRLYRDARWMGSFDFSKDSDLFNKERRQEMGEANELSILDNYASAYSTLRDSADFEDFYRLLTVFYLRIYMMDQVLVKVDRASMANSLEVRAPLLDSRVVDLALSLPMSYKLRPLTLPYIYETKYIFRKLMQDRLPNDIVWRPKKGFGVPMSAWLMGPLRPLLSEKLSKERLDAQGLFDFAYIDRLIGEHCEQKADHRKKLWTLLIFQLWWDRWMDDK